MTFVMVCCLMAIGCDLLKPTRVPLRQNLRSSIASNKAVVGFSQSEIRLSIHKGIPASPTGAVAVGVLNPIAAVAQGITSANIEVHRIKCAEIAIVPVRSALSDFDPATSLTTSLDRELAQVGWLKTESVEKSIIAPAEDREIGPLASIEANLSACKSDVLLSVRPVYHLTPEYDGILVMATVSLHPTKKPLTKSKTRVQDLPDAIYFNEFLVKVTLPDWTPEATADPAEAAKRWSVGQGTGPKEILAEALADLARMIAWDLQQDGSRMNLYTPTTDSLGSEIIAWSEFRYYEPDGSRNKLIQATEDYGPPVIPIVHESNGRKWARLPQGHLYSFNPRSGLSR